MGQDGDGADSPALRFGAFMPPIHQVGTNTTLELHRDLDLVVHLERLGFDEVWVGEHHSGGVEIIGSPELFLAAAAMRTSRIQLGTGVISLPYHHPLMVAERIVLLDRLSSGRSLLGCGPGVLPSDAYMLGIDPVLQRSMMEASLGAVSSLLSGHEPVTLQAEWFELREARLQMTPHNDRAIPVVVSAQVSMMGPRMAGRFGAGMMSMAPTTPAGFERLDRQWEVAERTAREFGRTIERGGWRLAGSMHLADTEEQARRDVAHGLREWVDYFQEVAVSPAASGLDPDGDLVDQVNRRGLAIIGTPEMAVERIRELGRNVVGYGTYVVIADGWAPWTATLHSFELFAEAVVPAVNREIAARDASRAWTSANRADFVAQREAALSAAAAGDGLSG